MGVFGFVPHNLVEVTDVSEVLSASVIRALIALVMETISTSETSVNTYNTTRRYNSADSLFHSPRRENLILNIFAFISEENGELIRAALQK
jgi:hypothetical protein